MSSREQFEAAFPVPEHVRWDGEQYLCDSRYQIRAFLTYCDQWDVWQASRQALVVELPAKISHLPHSQVGNGFVLPEAEQYDEAIDDCREAIEAAGVRVTP